MKSFVQLILISLAILSCTPKKETTSNVSVPFTDELTQLKEYFHIPGMAVIVEQNDRIIYENYLGVADIDTKTKLHQESLFPIASITKTFSAVLVMKLVEEKKLSLEDPINQYLSKPVFNDSILIKHVLSHTSQGSIGEQFYYSFRFGALKEVIEKASGTAFDSIMQKKVFDPIGLKHSFLLKDATQLKEKNIQLVQPYVYDAAIKKGFIDYGYSTSAGIVSNLHDLLLFNKALDNNTLISEASKNKMFQAFKPDLPYGFGIFNQQFDNEEIVWAYGQYDCYSSLFLKIPAKNISLIILANNNLMSDPARLINGDITTSLFALSFLKNYHYKDTTFSLFEPKEILTDEVDKSVFYRKKLLAEALSEGFMARFDTTKLQHSIELLEKVFTLYPDYLSYADINLLHNLSFIKEVAFHMNLGEINNFDSHIEAIANTLLKEDPQNPYVHYYIGNYYDKKGNLEQASIHFKAIINASNFSKWWYTKEAEDWLENHSRK